ncbi:MRG-domain-containing protein [Meredithblackwellia eburnea MCA 4105]
MATGGKFYYQANEKALCFHGPLMYEAKVLKAEIWSPETHPSAVPGPHYFVHYKGWKQTWDEWVPEERLKKYNDENLKQQKMLVEAQRARDAAERAAEAKADALAEAERKAKSAASGGGGGSGTGTGPGVASGSGSGSAAGAAAGAPGAGGRREEKRGQKRGRDGEGEEEYLKRPEIKISIPDALKGQLVDDWEAVTKNNQLVKLPRDPNVDIILEEWNKFHQNEEPETRRLTAEVSAGLRLYFNKALGNNLLYRFEREQYATKIKEEAAKSGHEVEVSSIYGAEHLLRLFVNLPELLAHTSMDPETVTVLKLHMSAFLSWMTLNKQILFSSTYENTSSAYQNNNKG